jgi:hypothetical protein
MTWHVNDFENANAGLPLRIVEARSKEERMSRVRWAVAGAGGYLIYKMGAKQERRQVPAAFALGETTGPNLAKFRNAGPAAIRDSAGEWGRGRPSV